MRATDGVTLSPHRRASNYWLVFVIIGAGAILAVLSYAYFVSTSAKIDETVRNDLRRQSRIETFQTVQLLEKEIQVVADNTRTGSSAPQIQNGDLQSGAVVLSARQAVTEAVTDRYLWVDKDGKTVWSTAFEGNSAEYQQFKGFDVSDRPYFAVPAATGQAYLSPVVTSPVDRSQRMFIAYPIIQNDEFKGVVAGSLRADTLGRLVESKLSPEIESSVGIIDPNGIIIYSANDALIGENLFGEKVQSALAGAFSSPQGLQEFNDFLKASVSGGTDSRDFSAATGQTTTVNYAPIMVKTMSATGAGPAEAGHHFLTMYLTAPHNVASIVGPLVEQERNFSMAVISAIAAVTAIISYMIISSNRRLEHTVEQRTASLKEANEKLKVHDMMQTEFINVAAHELRTPVQPLLSIAEGLEEECEGGAEEVLVTRPVVEMLARNAKRLSQLTSDVLEVTRIEGRSLRLNKEQVDLVKKITNVIQDSRSFIEDGRPLNIRFEQLAGPEPCIVEADKSKLFEVLSNLIKNAIKFTEEGAITVTLERNGSNAQVSVQDTGRGIDPEIYPRLFEKFTTKADTGTGLGLYISKSLVEAHGGRIWASNNSDGRGATFTFTLPLPAEKAEVPGADNK